jgi:SAM-dependent methyltransferase
MRNAEFEDPRLVPVYEALCPWGRDDEFFLSVVDRSVVDLAAGGRTVKDRTAPARVLDLGCGTGRLTLALASRGHAVTGVDPARASLDAARAKPGAEAVTWLEGSSEVLRSECFDVALMTSHVAQFIVDDGGWQATLRHVENALVPGGTLVFDTRDPSAREWERWNPRQSQRHVQLADGGSVDVWNQVDSVEGESVTFTLHYRFPDGEVLLSTSTLRFRPESAVRSGLQAAGFTTEQVYGGWDGQPVGSGDGELLVVARKGLEAPRAAR